MMQQGLRSTRWGWIILILAGCSGALPPVEATLPLLGSGLTPQPVTAQGSIEFDDIIDVEDTGNDQPIPARVGRQALAVTSLVVDYRMVYISSTAPVQPLCLSLGWFAVWGQVSRSQLFENPLNQRLVLPVTFVPQGADQWLAEGSRPYTPAEVRAFEAWLNSRPTSGDSQATVGARGQLVRCSDQSANGANLTGVLQIDTLSAQLVLSNSLGGNLPTLPVQLP